MAPWPILLTQQHFFLFVSIFLSSITVGDISRTSMILPRTLGCGIRRDALFIGKTNKGEENHRDEEDGEEKTQGTAPTEEKRNVVIDDAT